MRRRTWTQIVKDAFLSGTLSSVSTVATAAARGARDSGSAIAAVNAVSHIAWGSEASDVRVIDVKHTLPGLVLNTGATIFWAAIYEAAFGQAAERGQIGKAVLGGAAVSALAYVTDYHVVPKRLTPGWEERVSNRSLGVIYVVLALSLPARGLLRHLSRR